MSSTGLSGVAVSAATLGAVLIYAGFRGESPLAALRSVASGHPEPVVGHPTQLADSLAVPAGVTSSGSGLRAQVVGNAQRYAGDIYSQARRREAGYSDCSSFVDKALWDAGITPPGGRWANSANYRLAGDWKTIGAAQAQPGDIAVSVGHIVLVTGSGGSSGIGQQRTGVNVRTGPVSSLFSSRYVFRTWTGYGTVKPAGVQA